MLTKLLIKPTLHYALGAFEMGFLKFLKKGKREDRLDELDLPPAPPPLEDFQDDINMPEVPDLGDKYDQEYPAFGFNEGNLKNLEKEGMEDFPPYPPIQENFVPIPPITMPPVQMPPQQMQEIEKQDIPMERPLFLHEKKAVRVAMATSLYIRVDRFKAAMGGINAVRNDLKKSEEALMKFEGMKSMEEKSINKIKSSLDDLQKKFVFVDKTVFKGE